METKETYFERYKNTNLYLKDGGYYFEHNKRYYTFDTLSDAYDFLDNNNNLMAMPTNNIIENNKLIASFMGGKFRGESRLNLVVNEIWLPMHGVCRFDKIESGSGKILHYHNSFDWLMPVVEKIESLENYVIHQTFFNKREVVIKAEYNREFKNISINYEQPNQKLQATYKAVVEFIKWYNHEQTLSHIEFDENGNNVIV